MERRSAFAGAQGHGFAYRHPQCLPDASAGCPDRVTLVWGLADSNMGFFAELKRRNVIRVGVAYLVFSWLVLQVLDVVTPILDLPRGGTRTVFVLLGNVASPRAR